MHITGARVQHRQVPIAHRVATSFGTMDSRHAVFIVLEDEDGRCGVGESWVNFPAWAPWERVAAFERVLIPRVRGQQVDHISQFVTEVWTRFVGAAQQSGTVGPLLQAVCAIELALWDLKAQQASLPLAQLLFESPCDRVRVYASGINSPIPWDLVDEHLDRGVTLFKLKLGFGDEEDRRNLDALRRHLGDRAGIAVDVNRAWTLEQALRWLDILQDYDVHWVEEPLRIEEEGRLAALCDRGVVPIAGGENLLLPPGRDPQSVVNSGLNILQPDLTKYAPLHVSLRLLEAARASGKRLIPHFLGSAPGQAASLHFAAGCDQALVEWDINRNPLRTEMFAEPFEIKDGAITIPPEPGLGWHLR